MIKKRKIYLKGKKKLFTMQENTLGRYLKMENANEKF